MSVELLCPWRLQPYKTLVATAARGTMENCADGAAVHVILPGRQGQQQTKAQAALADATAVSEHATWAADAAAADEARSWSSTQMWVMFGLGWLFTPGWWLGVAAGLTTGKDRQCLLRKRSGLKPGQQAAWVANLIMTVVSTLVVVLVCSIYLTRAAGTHKGPGQSDEAAPSAVAGL